MNMYTSKLLIQDARGTNIRGIFNMHVACMWRPVFLEHFGGALGISKSPVCTMSWSSCNPRRYLPAFSQLSFVIFDLKICVDLPQRKTKRLPVAPEKNNQGGRIYDRFKKTLSTFWQKVTGKKVKNIRCPR